LSSIEDAPATAQDFDKRHGSRHWWGAVLDFYSLDEQLLDAVFLSDADDVRALLARGADPDARDEERRPALAVAITDGHGDIARLLLEAGADPDLCDRDRFTALDLAVYRRRLDLVWMLLAFGARVHDHGDGGASTLWRASLVSSDVVGMRDLLQRFAPRPGQPSAVAN
jgi:uncharacterized protein